MYEQKWITLYNPITQATHDFPDNPGVADDLKLRGWEDPPQPEPEPEEVEEKKKPAKKAASQKEGDEK